VTEVAETGMFGYARPTSIADALAALATEPGARPLMGGTDLLVAVRKGSARPPLIVDLKRVRELAPSIEERGGWLRVSASTVLSRVAADARVRSHFPALVEAADVVGSIQIRNRATLAGNLCNASPAADTAPPLIAYGATVELAGVGGVRHLPVVDFLLGPGLTALEPGELVSAVEVPLPTGPHGSAFARMTRRRGVDLATVNLACVIDAAGVARFGFGAVGPRPFAATDSSGVLAADDADPATVIETLRQVTAAATPISNVRAGRDYREAMLLVLAGRAAAEARRRRREAIHGG
jgi:CO/xanthine dehydrogenase FAD-binding subunit